MQQGTEFQRKESLHVKNSLKFLLECGHRLFQKFSKYLRNTQWTSEIVRKPLLFTVANSSSTVFCSLPPPHCFMHKLTTQLPFCRMLSMHKHVCILAYIYIYIKSQWTLFVLFWHICFEIYLYQCIFQTFIAYYCWESIRNM